MRRSTSIMNRNLFPHLRGIPALVCFAAVSLYQLTVPSMAMANAFGLSYFVHSGGDKLEWTWEPLNPASTMNGLTDIAGAGIVPDGSEFQYDAELGRIGTKVFSDSTGFWVSASVGVVWVDTFTLLSDSLEIGTPVSVTFSVTLDSSVPEDLGALEQALAWTMLYETPTAPFLGPYGSSPWVGLVDEINYGLRPHIVAEVVRDYSVGQSFSIWQFSGVEANHFGGNPGVGFSVDALNTALFSMSIPTQGVYYETASGRNYLDAAVPVPVPSGVFLVCNGLILLCAFRAKLSDKQATA